MREKCHPHSHSIRDFREDKTTPWKQEPYMDVGNSRRNLAGCTRMLNVT
jgi:hypothetical protein